MNEEHFIRLIELYAKDGISDVELQELKENLLDIEEDSLADVLAKEWMKDPKIHQMPIIDNDMEGEILEKILSIDKRPAYKSRKHQWTTWIAAAIFLGVIFGSLYFVRFSSKFKNENAASTNLVSTGILMTTQNGTTTRIDQIKDSVIKNTIGSAIHIKNGHIAYDSLTEASVRNINTIVTTAGQQYKIDLPDGTKVWLNALSSISFPSKFEDKIRRVSMKGEVYFEVANDHTKPFIVETAQKLKIAVLGTHFNINAYDNNTTTSATLIEGQIRLSNGSTNRILSPGQQARILKNQDDQKLDEAITVIDNANIDETIAWVNGLFYFNNHTLEQVSKELERWYNIQIVFQGKIPKTRFRGEMDRGLTLPELQKLLSDWGIATRMVGRKMIVL